MTDGLDGRGLPDSLERTHLLDEHLMLVVGRGHQFARRRAVFLREVSGDTIITGSDTDENSLLRAHHLDFPPAVSGRGRRLDRETRLRRG